MNRIIRIIKLLFLGIALLLCLAVPVIGLVSTAQHWQGICSDLNGGQLPCTGWDYARGEMFWTLMVFIPFMFVTSLVWIGMALVQFIVSQLAKRKK
jgi:hypothetical protein